MQIAHVYVGFLRILEEMGVETRTDQYRNAKSSRFLCVLFNKLIIIMALFKIKIFKQLTGECCKVLLCEKQIQQEAKEEYSHRVKEIELLDGEYYSQLFRVHNDEEHVVRGVPSYSLKIENHQTTLNQKAL